MNSPTLPAQIRNRQAQRQRIMITPEGVALPLTIASRGARAAALALDLIILATSTIAFTIIVFTTALGVNIAGSLDSVPGSVEFLFIVWSLMWFFAWNGYFMYFEMGPRGATPGKRIAGVRVASRDGARLSPEAIVARNLLRDVELFLPLVMIYTTATSDAGLAGWSALLWFLTFLLFPFFNKDSMRAGDLIAGTWVLDAPKQKLAVTLSTEGAASGDSSALTGTTYRFSDQELSVYGEHELQTLERVLRSDRKNEIEAVAETICVKIGWTAGSGDEKALLEAYYGQLRAKLESDMRFGKRKADKFS